MVFSAQRKLSASVLSLNEIEGEELLRLSQAFPPPPEGEVLDFCNPYDLVREILTMCSIITQVSLINTERNNALGIKN